MDPMRTQQKSADRTALAHYQTAMAPLLRGRLQRWQWYVVGFTLLLVSALGIMHASITSIWFALCIGFIAINFAPARSPARFVRFLAHRSPLKPVAHVRRVLPNGVIELDFVGTPRVVVAVKALGVRGEESNRALRTVATAYGATVEAVITTGMPRTAWHERAGWPMSHCLIMGRLDGDASVASCADRLVKAITQAGLEQIVEPDRSVFEVSAGHGCWTAHYFVELMPFDQPSEFIDKMVAEPVDKTLIMGLRAERKGDDLHYIASFDAMIFAADKAELSFYARTLEALAKANWMKVRSLRWRKLPFAAAFHDEPLFHEIPFEMHPTDGPILALDADK
jgi:hypothetical protein